MPGDFGVDARAAARVAQEMAAARYRHYFSHVGSGRNPLSAEEVDTPAMEDESIIVEVKQRMRKRHLDQDERRLLHKPKRDWVMTGRGEVPKTTSALDVSDLIAKVK